MSEVTPKDGTRIAYERLGSGPPVVLIDGALCSREFGPMPQIAALLAPNFTVYLYDRRGRGASGARHVAQAESSSAHAAVRRGDHGQLGSAGR